MGVHDPFRYCHRLSNPLRFGTTFTWTRPLWYHFTTLRPPRFLHLRPAGAEGPPAAPLCAAAVAAAGDGEDGIGAATDAATDHKGTDRRALAADLVDLSVPVIHEFLEKS